MSLRAADARLLLPRPAQSAAVLPGLPEWEAALRLAGIDVVTAGSPQDASPVDLVVAPAPAVDDAVRRGADQILLVGAGSQRALRAAGYHVEYYLCRSGERGPRLLVPFRHGNALRYLIGAGARPRSATARIRSGGVLASAAAGVPIWRLGRLVESVTVAARRPAPPYPLDVDPLGNPAQWALGLGAGDDLQRAVFQVFAPGARAPGRVVKVARVRGYRHAFDLDEAGLRMAAEAGPVTAAHTPALLARAECGGLQVAVESAAVGRPLHEILAGPGRDADKHRLIDAIAGWILELGRESAQPGPALESERLRLRALGSGEHPLLDVDQLGALVDRVPITVPGVLQHNDLGSWNIVAGLPDRFVVVDWESARRPGLPLWDLVYFLTDSLLRLGDARPAVTPARVLDLFRGADPQSGVLFRWVRAAVTAHGLPPESVGTIVTLCLAHHATSPAARGRWLDEWVGSEASDDGLAETTVWRDTMRDFLADPVLGAGWDRWRQ